MTFGLMYCLYSRAASNQERPMMARVRYLTYNSMNNLSSYCGLVDAKIRASDKDLPVSKIVSVFI